MYSYTYGDPSKGEIPDTLYKYEIGNGIDIIAQMAMRAEKRDIFSIVLTLFFLIFHSLPHYVLTIIPHLSRFVKIWFRTYRLFRTQKSVFVLF